MVKWEAKMVFSKYYVVLGGQKGWVTSFFTTTLNRFRHEPPLEPLLCGEDTFNYVAGILRKR